MMKYFIVTSVGGERYLMAANREEELKAFGDFNNVLELTPDTFTQSGFIMAEK